MATELGLLSLTQFQKLAQSQQNQNQHHHRHQPDPNLTAGSWMWNPKAQSQEALADDDSWEVRAFAKDTGNIMGTTWPPRFYTCTFCRREFRSAQALGGHMNVHRRDRARLHQTQPGTGALINPSSSSSTTTTTSSSTLLIPTQEFAANGGLCLLYQLPNPNGVFTSPPMNGCPIDSPSTLLSISPYPSYNFMVAAPSINFPTPPVLSNYSSSHCYSTKAEPSPKLADNTLNQAKNIGSSKSKETSIEELDLELRLGHRPTTS